MNLDDIWRQLSEGDGRSSSPGLLVRRIDPDSPIDLFVGVKTDFRTRFLLLRLAVEPRLPRAALIQSRGFRTSLTRFEGDARGSASLVIEATEPLFNDMFGVLAGEIIESGRKRTTDEPMLSAMLACLQRWKKFFDSSGAEGLGDEALLGLLAELHFLEAFCIPHTPTRVAALSAWVGPDPLSKDFQFPGCAVEVKCSASREHTKINISGERQLDSQGFEALFLFVLFVERVGEGGTTVPERVESLRANLGDGSGRFLFEEKLVSAGYHDIHKAKYVDKSFLIKTHKLFLVTNSFPRLIPPLPPGVGDLSYTIVLSACQKLATTDTEVIRAISKTVQPL